MSIVLKYISHYLIELLKKWYKYVFDVHLILKIYSKWDSWDRTLCIILELIRPYKTLKMVANLTLFFL
jgi:hypothetical protein